MDLTGDRPLRLSWDYRVSVIDTPSPGGFDTVRSWRSWAKSFAAKPVPI